MLTAQENDLLCRVEGDAPMGQMMRRYWLPACTSEEVAARDGAPVRVRMLGEDLVAFRDTDGRLGVLGEHCPHRRASLALGRNEECALRCLYHGWKMDVEGNVLEMPSATGRRFSRARSIRRTARPCIPPICRPPRSDAEVNDYVGITTFVAPITVLIPPNNVYNLANVNVPMDDTHTIFYFIAWSDRGPGIEPDAWRAFCHARAWAWTSTRNSAACARATKTTCRTGAR